MPTPLTLSTAPFEHPAMDYAFLREEGIRHLERLAGSLWTDFNAHDPGITILEQLCYALTDLAYRINYELVDLLTTADGHPANNLYSPAQILTSNPVTLTDLRKLVIDVPGVKNAWIEKVEEQRLPLYFAAGDKTLSLGTASDAAVPIALKGLYRVLIEKSDLADIDGTVVQREATRRLHAHRNLCEDFAEIRILESQNVAVAARVEVGPLDDVEDTLATIYQRIAAYFSPSIRFYMLSQLLAAGKPIDEIFDGPALVHGFIDTSELQHTPRRAALRTSDLIREIMDVPGVRAVRSISIVLDGRSEPWSMNLDRSKTPKLDLAGSTITLERNQLRASVNVERVHALYVQRLRAASISQPLAIEERDLLVPRGRERGVARYHSIQYQFPAAYGIGEMGLPDSASIERKAQAKQLKAYLMLFDQLLANYFAQLAHVKDLFSFGAATKQTYFSQVLSDPTIHVEEVLQHDLAEYQSILQRITENPYDGAAADSQTDVRRKNVFLNHLLARFAEQFADYALLVYDPTSAANGSVEEKLTSDKQLFLQDYPRVSSARGTGFNYLLPWSDENRSGLEQRLRRKVGIDGTAEEACYVIEHILLRPIDDDNRQQAPLLSNTRSKDPYSLQLSVVLPSWPHRFQNPEFKHFVENTIREETPAHVTVYVQWLDKEAMGTFVTAYEEGVKKRRTYWQEKLGT